MHQVCESHVLTSIFKNPEEPGFVGDDRVSALELLCLSEGHAYQDMSGEFPEAEN